MKKIMILGGGNCQLNTIKKAKNCGLYTIVVDYNISPQGAIFADEHIQISTFDLPQCMKVAKENVVDAILTVGTDQPLYTCAVIAEETNIPFTISAEIALNATNKQHMKKIFNDHNIKNTPHIFLKDSENIKKIETLKPPYILKPIDSQGQRGIYKLDTANQVQSHIKKCLTFSRSDTVLVEEFYENSEITVSGWVFDGELKILSITDRLCIESDNSVGVCYGHRFPSKYRNYKEELEALTYKITKDFKVQNGPIYYQFLLGKDGILVNEIAFRIGGAFEDFLIPAVSGFDIAQALIDASLGKSIDNTCLKNYNCWETGAEAAIQLMFCQSGEIHDISDLCELTKLNMVLDAGYNYKIGQQINETVNATARFGHCILLGKNGELPMLNKAFWDIFYVKDKLGKNIEIQRIIT